MTIKQIEQQSGLTRANIRFYEEEGLIHPRRLENGYRDYTDAELEMLLRIKLLRSLGLTLEEIKLLQREELSLAQALERRRKKIEDEQEQLTIADHVCQTMCEDQADFDTLDAQHYLDKMQQQEETKAASPMLTPVLEHDRAVQVQAPFRRLAARLLDMTLAGLIVHAVLCGLLHWNPQYISSLIKIPAQLALVCILEPLLLHFLGTTPGKAVMGLSVASCNGGKLSIREARERTVSVLWHGMGMQIPILNLVRLYHSYQQCQDGFPLTWECDSTLRLRDTRPWRVVAMVASWLVVYCAFTMVAFYSTLPPNRGPLTVAQFAENYNFYIRYYRLSEVTSDFLDARGMRQQERNPGVVIEVTGPFDDGPEPSFQYDVDDDGLVRGIVFENIIEPTDDERWLSMYRPECIASLLAMTGAEPVFGLFPEPAPAERVVHWLLETPFTDFETRIGPLIVSHTFTNQGYMQSTTGAGHAILIPISEEEHSCTLRFEVRYAD